MNYRIEKDSLGEMQVPAGAYYGVQTQRAVLNFPVSGMRPYRAFVWSMAAIKRAAADVNRDLGLLDPKLAEAITAAAAEVMDGQWADHFVVDPFQAGAGTSHNMNVNEVIANRASELLGVALDAPKKPVSPNDHVNMAQSTNDTIPTAIRLGCLWRLPELLDAVNQLADRAGGQGRRVRRRGEVRPHPPARRRAGAAGPGVRRLRQGRVPRRRTHRPGCGRPAPHAHRRHGHRHRPERAPRIPRPHGRAPERAARPAAAHLGQPVRGHAEHGRHGRLQRQHAHARHHADPHRQRLPPAELRAFHRPGRDPPAGGAARLVHHARQGQPGAGRDARTWPASTCRAAT